MAISESRASLHQARTVIEDIRKNKKIYHDSQLLKDLSAAEERITRSEKLTQEALQEIEPNPPSAIRTLSFLHSPVCNTCKRHIARFSWYYRIPNELREMQGYGTFNNDIHCQSCHQQAVSQQGDCYLCSEKLVG